MLGREGVEDELFPAFLTLSVLMVRNFYCNGNPPVQMLRYFGAQLRPILPEQGFVRGIDGEGNPAALRQEAISMARSISSSATVILSFPLAVIALQQRFPVFIRPCQPYNRALPVQIHLHLRVDGQIYGRIGL